MLSDSMEQQKFLGAISAWYPPGARGPKPVSPSGVVNRSLKILREPFESATRVFKDQ